MVKQLPHDIPSEMCLLGAMVIDPSVVPDVVLHVRPSDFHDARHTILFSTIDRVHGQVGTCDGTMLASALRVAGHYDSVGGLKYIAEVVGSTPSAVNWPHYAKAVTDKARLRRIIETADAYAYQAAQNPADVDQFASDALAAFGRACETSGRGKPTVGIDVALEEFLCLLDEGKAGMVPTGLVAFDGLFGGLPRSGLVTIMGPPGCGKSSFVSSIMPQLVTLGGGRIYSFEMGPRNLAASVASAQTKTALHRYAREGKQVSFEEHERIDAHRRESAKWNVEICKDNPTASDIYRRCVSDYRAGVRWILVDYVQNLPRKPAQTETEAVADGMRVLQQISRELSMLVMCVSQVTASASRTAAEQKQPPKSSDGVGSGAIEQASDMIVGVFRPAKFENPNDFGGVDSPEWQKRRKYAELHVLKNKFGPQGNVVVDFLGDYVRFENVEGPNAFA